MEVVHLKSMAMWGVAIVRSGEVGSPLGGSRVGESSLSKTRSQSVRDWEMMLPRASARLSLVAECQAGLWALKSPRIKESSGGENSLSKSGVKDEGHEEVGGI